MDIVLGVSMTPSAVRIVLVEGENADGVTVDHDVFDVTAIEDAATSGAAAQVVAAILGTHESAAAGGHRIKAIGVAWNDHAQAADLDEELVAWGVEDVTLVSETHAAGALAQAVGRAMGYTTTALLFIEPDTVTLSIVRTDDGSVVKVLSRSLYFTDLHVVLPEMAAAVNAQDSTPGGVFVIGSGADVDDVKGHLEQMVSVPVNAPEEADLALARGAALASASTPAFEASTVGLAYSQDPDAVPAGPVHLGLDAAATQLAPCGGSDPTASDDIESALTEEYFDQGQKPFLLVGSALTSVFVIGVVALVISMAVSIRPTVDQRPSPGESPIAPSSQRAESAHQAAQPIPPPPPAVPAQTIKAPAPVAREAAPAPQAPPRTVFVERPAPPAPQAPAPAPPPAAPPAPAPPAYTPPVVVPPPMILLPQPQWPSFFNPPVLTDIADPAEGQDPPAIPEETQDTSDSGTPVEGGSSQPDPAEPAQPEEPSQPTTSQAPQATAPQATSAPPSPSATQETQREASSPAGSGSDSGSESSAGSGDSGGSSTGGSSPLWPLPVGGGED